MTPKPFCWIVDHHDRSVDILKEAPIDKSMAIELFTLAQLEAARKEAFEEACDVLHKMKCGPNPNTGEHQEAPVDQVIEGCIEEIRAAGAARGAKEEGSGE